MRMLLKPSRTFLEPPIMFVHLFLISNIRYATWDLFTRKRGLALLSHPTPRPWFFWRSTNSPTYGDPWKPLTLYPNVSVRVIRDMCTLLFLKGNLRPRRAGGAKGARSCLGCLCSANISIKVLIPWRISPISVANYSTLLSTTNPPVDPAAGSNSSETEFRRQVKT